MIKNGIMATTGRALEASPDVITAEGLNKLEYLVSYLVVRVGLCPATSLQRFLPP
jgi:hypothetical protein